MMEWDQLTEEPPAAYARFLVYLHLGAGRTLQAAWDTCNAQSGTGRKKSQKMSGQWGDDSTTYRWVERAKAWDIAEQQRLATERQEEERARRRVVMGKYHEKVIAMTDALDPAKVSTAQVLEAIRHYLAESRQETSDLPAMQHDHRHTGKAAGLSRWRCRTPSRH